MMAESARIPVEIQLILNKWTRDARTVVRDARAIDQALDDAKRSAKQLAATLNSLKSGKIAFDVDLSAIDKAASAAKSLDGLSPDVTVQVDTSQIMGAEIDLRTLDNISPDVTVDVSVDEGQIQSDLNSIVAPDLEVAIHGDATAAKAVLDSLKAPAPVIVEIDADETKADTRIDNVARRKPKVTAEVDADTSSADTKIKRVRDSTGRFTIPVDADTTDADTRISNVARRKPKVTAQVDGDTSGVESKLDDLKRLAKIQIVFDIVGAAAGTGGELPIFSTVGALDAAVGKVTARTKLAATEAETVLRTAYTNAFGESYDQLAEFLSLTAQLPSANQALGESFLSVMTTADVTGQDFVKTLEVMDKLVSTGLVSTFTEASDLIIGGFQLGANRSDDFLDTLREYAIQFEAGGVSAATAVDLMVQALNAGAFNTDKVADTIKENLLKINEAAGDVAGSGGTAKPILEQMGLMDEASAVAAGELSSNAFAETFINTLNEQLASGVIDEDQVRFMMTEVFGTPIEDLGFDLFKNLDFSESTLDFTGVAEEAGQQFYDNLSTKFTELKRVVEDEFITTLQQGGLDFGQLIDDAKDKVGELATLLRGGTALPDALEVVLEAPGLANTIRDFESFFGNAVIELLTGFSNLATTLFPDTDVSGLDATIADLAARQLSFDVQLADDAQGVEDAVARALNRGVTSADIGTALNTALDDALSRGDFNLAQQLIEQVATAAPQMIAQVDISGISPLTGDMGTETLKIPITNIDMTLPQDQIQAQIDAQVAAAIQAKGEGKVFVPGSYKLDETAVDTTGFETKVDDAIVAAKDQFDAAVTAGDFDLAKVIAAQLAEIPTAFDDALAEGNFVLAEAIAGALGEGELTTIVADLRAEAGETGTSFQAMASGLNESNEAANALTGTTSGYMTQLDRLVRTQGDALTGFEDLTKDGIAPATTAMGELSTATAEYTTGLQGQLAIAKDTWQDYLDYLAENAIPLDVALGGVPTVPSKGDGLATGGRANPGWTLVGEQGPELAYFGQGADVLNNQTSTALMSLIGQLGGGGNNTTNYINVNVMNNNASQAAGMASVDRLGAQLRGFAR